MKKIVIKNIKKELQQYNADETVQQLVLNNIALFNDLIDEYNGESKHQAYLIYQLNMQIFKMLLELKKGKPVDETQDKFTQMIKAVQKNKEKKYIETR
jgi:hypothetical protein